jgi:hypothetical protein
MPGDHRADAGPGRIQTITLKFLPGKAQPGGDSLSFRQRHLDLIFGTADAATETGNFRGLDRHFMSCTFYQTG